MRILLDECVNAGVGRAFSSHEVRTVSQTGWRSTEDGQLLILAEQHFDVFVTIDRSLEYQQNLSEFRLGFVIVRVRSNEIASFQPLFAQLRQAVETIRAGEVIHILSAGIGAL